MSDENCRCGCNAPNGCVVGALEAENERLRAVVDAAPDAIMDALNAFGGLDPDKDDDPEGFEMMVFVAKKALADLDKQEGGNA